MMMICLTSMSPHYYVVVQLQKHLSIPYKNNSYITCIVNKKNLMRTYLNTYLDSCLFKTQKTETLRIE